MDIANNKEGYEALWRRIGDVEGELRCRWKRLSVRNVALLILGEKGSDEAVWEICTALEMGGYDLLPPPEKHPRKCRDLLAVAASILLEIPRRQVDLAALDAAFRTVYGDTPRLNVSKKGRQLKVES